MSASGTYEVSAAALRPLMRAYWSPRGWRTPPVLPEGDEFAAAVAAGVMFVGMRDLSHDEWVQAACRIAARTAPVEVEEAFIVSLTSRRLDLRSALGSYAVARNLPSHEFAPMAGSGRCAVCGIGRRAGSDPNVLSFERFKWAGVRRDDVRYVAFDLEQFERAPRVDADGAALAVGRELIRALREPPPPESTASSIRLLRTIKGSAAERASLVDILGVCGLLAPAAHPGYLGAFPRFADRESPPRRFVDQAYPACWWRGADGVAERAVPEYLPRLLRTTDPGP